MPILIRSIGPRPLQERYKQSIEDVLATIRGKRTGRTVLAHIKSNTHLVIISPFLGPGGNNATTHANATAAGSFSADRTASGTTVRISFSVDRIDMPVHVPGSMVDEILLHELAHALRFITGTARLARVGGVIGLLQIASFRNVEEFFAIMVVSVYSSESGREARGNHGRWPLRDTSVLNNRPFITRLQEICTRMSTFSADMAGIPEAIAAFNPFRNIIRGEPIS